jgi:hypothetical protein
MPPQPEQTQPPDREAAEAVIRAVLADPLLTTAEAEALVAATPRSADRPAYASAA